MSVPHTPAEPERLALCSDCGEPGSSEEHAGRCTPLSPAEQRANERQTAARRHLHNIRQQLEGDRS